MTDYPMIFRWSEDLHDADGVVTPAMVPMPRFRKAAAEQFKAGEVYRMEAIEESSARSRGHYFATLHEMWLSLPEHFEDRFPTVTHLRKWALIKTGYCNQEVLALKTKADAHRVAAVIRRHDDFAIITVKEAVVSVYTAKSQSLKAMGKKDFQASKQAVLDLVAGMIGVKKSEIAA